MYSWPAGVNRTYTVDAYLEAYGTLGYVPCGGDATLRDGYQKVALYTKNNFPTHAARQLPDGWWASKLGQYVDVEHTLVALDGPDYGEATIFLERPIP